MQRRLGECLMMTRRCKRGDDCQRNQTALDQVAARGFGVQMRAAAPRRKTLALFAHQIAVSVASHPVAARSTSRNDRDRIHGTSRELSGNTKVTPNHGACSFHPKSMRYPLDL